MERHNYKYFSAFLFVLISYLNISWAQLYNIQIEFDEPVVGSCLLSYYMGPNLIFVDSSVSLTKKVVQFKGDIPLNPGLYIIKSADSHYMELLLSNDHNVKIYSDNKFHITNIKIEGDPETKAFLEYQKYMYLKNEEKAVIRKYKLNNNSPKDTIKKYQNHIKKINKDIQNNWNEITINYPNTFLGNFIKLFILPEIPDYITNKSNEDSDSLQWMISLQYFRNHYLDHVTFNDPRLLRTPVFHDKIFTFFTKIAHQDPDSLISAIDNTFLKQDIDPEVFRYFITTMLNYYDNNPKPHHDEIYIHLVDNYFLTGNTPWVTLPYQKKLDKKADIKRNTCIGAKFNFIELYDLDDKPIDIDTISTNITILIFWSTHCDKCEKSLLKLSKEINRETRRSISIVGINLDNDPFEVKNYIKLYGFDWINVTGYRNIKEIESIMEIDQLPLMLLLDKEHHVLLKTNNASQIIEKTTAPEHQ